ncbi:MAG: NADH-quinone oxidoreductase subunit L [Gemmataceae bacterium]
MSDFFREHPGRWFVVAALLPLAAAVVLLVAGTARNLARSLGRHWHLPPTLAGYLVLAAMVASAGCAIAGLLSFDPHGPADAERADWVRVGAAKWSNSVLELGYHIDTLSAVLCTMVTVIGSLIVLFSVGYMRDEANPGIEDHEVHTAHGHLHRRGRFGRFFLYLALFAFSMLNLLIADNLMQVFVGWELVGACSFFLIGFYYERPSAQAAATKAFIVNRIGDAGFLVGIAVAWSQCGTLNIQELIRLVPTISEPYLTLMGLGIFVGCVGKSAQLPLHTWLPDAMEGPTPVSALIHAATMVAAGVYLVGRCFPLFSPTVLVVIAYTGAFTLFVAATIACVQTDIKRVLAYSTMSQLGYMMLALGVGGWSAGQLHLLTHAFFKALLFLAAGSAILGLHHAQDLRHMGGLRTRMPVTAYTTLIGVLAIAGFPLLSGWYSKDQILSAALGFSLAEPKHALLFFLPLVTALMTAYYMGRLWLLAFAGTPRSKAAEHAHESPWAMTLPLVVLAAFSVGVAWGWPVWDAGASALGKLLHTAEPPRPAGLTEAHHLAEQYHLVAGGLALLAAAAGGWVAYSRFQSGALLAPSSARFLVHKWYFDELYAALFVRPTVRLAQASGSADRRRPTGDGPGETIDPGTVDGLLNAVGQSAGQAGRRLREVQTGWLRGYVAVLGLTVAGLLGMLVVFSAR